MVQLLARIGIVGEHDPLAIGRDVEQFCARVTAWQLDRAAFQQVGDAPGGDVQNVQMHDAAHRQVVVPVAVLRFTGDIGAFFACFELLVALGLRLAALQVRPHPGDESDAPTVWKPLECRHSRAKVGQPAPFTAVGCNGINLRGFVFASFLFALAHKSDHVTRW